MTKFKDLTEKQQRHFMRLINDYEIPKGTTHIDMNDNYGTSFTKRSDGEYYSYDDDTWVVYEHLSRLDLYPLPSPPYYNPENTTFKATYQSGSNVYVIDIEAINEVAELIQQNNPHRHEESLHSIRNSIWDLIKQSTNDNFEMVSTGGVTVFKSYGEDGEDGVIDISVMYNPCRDHKYVTMSQEEIEDI